MLAPHFTVREEETIAEQLTMKCHQNYSSERQEQRLGFKRRHMGKGDN